MTDIRTPTTDASAPDAAPSVADVDADVRTLAADGVVARRGAFTRGWVERMRDDIEVAFADAVARPGGAVARGPQRWYVEIHPQQLRGFVDLATHPWVVATCEAVLGPRWTIVELGFDVPFPGAADQPWHRDFPSPPETHRDRRITSLAFNLTAVDTVDEMGPFEIAKGTHFEPGLDWESQMFPPESEWPRYAAMGVRTYPEMGNVSARSALTIHRGTANRSRSSRPVLVMGVDAPGAGHDALHDPMVTPEWWEAAPQLVREHLHCRVVDELVPIVQKHQIDGLLRSG